MLLFAYFDGATGPVRLVGWTNYDEDYAATECARQERRERWPYGEGEGEGNAWTEFARKWNGIATGHYKLSPQLVDVDWLGGFQARCRKLLELCEAMRKAAESKP